jgi:hypothetical protein
VKNNVTQSREHAALLGGGRGDGGGGSEQFGGSSAGSQLLRERQGLAASISPAAHTLVPFSAVLEPLCPTYS